MINLWQCGSADQKAVKRRPQSRRMNRSTDSLDSRRKRRSLHFGEQRFERPPPPPVPPLPVRAEQRPQDSSEIELRFEALLAATEDRTPNTSSARSENLSLTPSRIQRARTKLRRLFSRASASRQQSQEPQDRPMTAGVVF